MAKIKLTPAERMLVSIADTERQQALQQIDSIYTQRVQALLDTHGIRASDKPQVIAEGQDAFLVTADEPSAPALVP